MRKFQEIKSSCGLKRIPPRKIRENQWIANKDFEDIGLCGWLFTIEDGSKKFYNDRLIELTLHGVMDGSSIILLRIVAPTPRHQIVLEEFGDVPQFSFVRFENARYMMRFDGKIQVYTILMDIGNQDGCTLVKATEKCLDPASFQGGILDGRFYSLISKAITPFTGQMVFDSNDVDNELKKIARNKPLYEPLYANEVVKNLSEDVSIAEFLMQARLFSKLQNTFCGLPIGKFDSVKVTRFFQNSKKLPDCPDTDSQTEAVILTEDEILERQLSRCDLKIEDFSSDDTDNEENLDQTVHRGLIFGEREESDEEAGSESELINDDPTVADDDPQDLYTRDFDAENEQTQKELRDNDDETSLADRIKALASNINSESSDDDSFQPARPSTPVKFDFQDPTRINPSTPRKKNPFLYRQKLAGKPAWKRFLFRRNSEETQEPATKKAKTDAVITISSDSDE
ncbi:Oidioi.mRNA.OKI2018_I69.chr2.g6969.t1.cds [Oikopleura dioica]|uniref:Oidioi.mRNA.OKI2018_I69.chr2.g6969.t1.cds n=1 Tax=Oikopleura dioica TaxID=34765 RepID=A0ABN7T4N8_OIKDI|nr:Oidioi.mRNA.OKI2018_I69.chr2.g6969.t1.cds [Oikopleura dioica]